MCEESESRALGSRQYAIAKSQAATQAGQATHRLWVDGVLDDGRIARLRAEPRVVSAIQYDRYVLSELSGYIDGMRLREYLDPHVFVLQRDLSCNTLEINFNPTPEQVGRLRDFYKVIQKIELNHTTRSRR